MYSFKLVHCDVCHKSEDLPRVFFLCKTEKMYRIGIKNV
jgi:hypothetical protein